MLEAVYESCVRCGLCLPSCPTYLETLTETSGPRGRIALIKSVDRGHIDLLSPGFVEQMSQCLDCRACEAVCPSGVQYGELVETMRARIEDATAPARPPFARFLRGLVLGRLFANLAWLRAAARALRFVQRSGLHSFAALFGVRELAALAPRIDDRFFTARDQRIEAASPQGVAFLHVGCVMQVAFSRVHEATVRMLRRAGLTTTVPSDQGCCGAIAVHAGDETLARELARRNIAAFERSGADVYVVNAAGCGSALKEYPRLFRDEPQWHARAQAFSARVRDITEVLDAMPFALTRPIEGVVTYQDPCHLAHAQRVTASPRRLLARIPNIQLAELGESAVCCGSAGVYNVTEPEMAERLLDRKMRHIETTGATILATANPGCALQIAAGARARRLDLRVAHIVELLDEASA